MSTVTNSVTNRIVVNFNPWVIGQKISHDIQVVPAAGLEPARPKPGDFKSPTYPNEVNGLTS
jgi:hypothetical protein